MQPKKSYLSYIVLFLLSVQFSNAQYFARKDSWKKERKEILVGLGANNCLTDIGGLNRIGTHYSYADMKFVFTNFSASLGYRYRLNKSFASRTEFSYLKLTGTDATTKEPFRHNRNLNFKTNVFEFATVIEFALSNIKKGNRYHIKKTLFRRKKSMSSYYYLFAGIGGFYFNPQAQYGGNWYPLHSMSTEGEGLPGGPKQYSLIAISIPFGIGARYKLNTKWTIGIEYNFRKTFTDYLDDCSGKYYDNNKILLYKGPIAAHLADPNLGLIPGQSITGQERGDPTNKDAYFNLQVKVGYTLAGKKKRRITKAKF